MTVTVIPLRSTDADWPRPLHDAALHGVVGDLVRTIEPHTESDPVAILVQSLVVFGSLLGRSGYYQVEASRHYANEFAVLVGSSSKARKGSSLDQVMAVFAQADPDWALKRIASGLASGEGLIWKVRDGDPASDNGDVDKRLLTIEAEFASVLKVAKRQENTLSAILRNAWDGKPLETLNKTSPARASEPHISIIGHITRDELLRNVDATEIANGFFNRFMHFAVRSSKSLPFGGEIDEVDFGEIVERLRSAAAFGRRAGRLRFADDARELWPEHYARLRDSQHGMLGAVTARAEAHVVRLALLYALLDCSEQIGAAHLRAALALWGYAERSARWVYGCSLGDPLADELWSAISVRPEGMSRTEIRDWFSRNKKRSDIDRALGVMTDAGLIERRKEARAIGAPEVEVWVPVS
jgi:hypothetical protein